MVSAVPVLYHFIGQWEGWCWWWWRQGAEGRHQPDMNASNGSVGEAHTDSVESKEHPKDAVPLVSVSFIRLKESRALTRHIMPTQILRYSDRKPP